MPPSEDSFPAGHVPANGREPARPRVRFSLPNKTAQAGNARNEHSTSRNGHHQSTENISAITAEAIQTREQLLGAVSLCHMTVFTVDRYRKVTMVEGALVHPHQPGQGGSDESKWFVGQEVEALFYKWFVAEDIVGEDYKHHPRLVKGPIRRILGSLESILAGKAGLRIEEYKIDGRPFWVRLQPLLGNEGAACFMMDISVFKRRAEHFEARKREDLGLQILAGISHETCSPITDIVDLAWKLLSDGNLGEESRDLVHQIHASATCFLSSINDILDSSKPENGPLDIAEMPCSLSALYKDIKYMLRFAAGNRWLSFHVHMATDIEGDLEFPGKGTELRLVMGMLMANSIKSTERGYVKLSILKESETATSTVVKFILEDTSRRACQETHGSTLLEIWSANSGRTLSIVKPFIESASGRMVLDSSPGIGTTITLWLPFAKPATRYPTRWSQSTPAPDTSSSAVSGPSTISLNLSPRAQPLNMFNPGESLPKTRRSTLLILIASANPITQQFTTSYLKTAGFQTTTVRTGSEALTYLTAAMRNEQPKPALLLLDDQTPDPEPNCSTECSAILRTRQPYRDFLRDVPIIALTAAADPPVPPAATTNPDTTGSRIKDGKRASCLGEMCFVEDYLPKPVTRDALERMVVWWIVRGRSELGELSRGGIGNGGLVPERGVSGNQREEEASLDGTDVEKPEGPVNKCVLQ